MELWDKQLQNRIPTKYPKRVLLNPKYKNTCKNDEIKQEHAFYVNKRIQKQLLPTSPSKITWIGSLKASTSQLAILNAKRGKCNDVHVYPGSRKCGIGKEMMKMCLKDDDITEDGGYNPMTEKDWYDEDLEREARKLCKAIVLVTCKPYDSTPNIAGKLYMEAALDSGFHLVFIQKLAIDDAQLDKIRRYDIEAAKLDFLKNADAFIEDMGANWFFCKCKQDSKQDCLGISTINILGILFYMNYLFTANKC